MEHSHAFMLDYAQIVSKFTTLFHPTVLLVGELLVLDYTSTCT